MTVLDASAWVDVLVSGAAPPDPEEPILVPPHFDAEVVGALRALAQRDVLSSEQADTALDLHLRADFLRELEPEDIRQAWRWREDLSITDGWYAAMARRRGAVWLTTDGRAAGTASRLGVLVSAVLRDDGEPAEPTRRPREP